MIKNFRFNIQNHYFNFETSLRILRSKYESLEDLFNSLNLTDEFKDYMSDVWDSLSPLTLNDLITMNDVDRRRALFQYLPLSMIFEDAKILDTRTEITKQDDEFIENTYVLVRKLTKEIYPEYQEPNPKHIYAVKVQCVSTNKVYYLQVPWDQPFTKKGSYDATAAIAWTAHCPITNPKALRRQGDVFFWEVSPDSVYLEKPVPLTKEEYLSLLVHQS